MWINKPVKYAPDENGHVVIPYGTNKIERELFDRAGDMVSVDIPDTVTAICYGAFSGSKLTSLFLPESVKNVNPCAFYGCNDLESIEADENNPYLSSFDGILFSKDRKTLIKFPNNRSGRYDIPAYVECIDSHAFAFCEKLEEIIIPESVKNISHYAFYVCESLKRIFIPRSVMSIGSNLFMLCNSLESIEADADNPCVSSFDGVLFSKDRKTLIKFPNNRSGRYDVPDGVEYITGSAFSSSKLNEVVVSGSVKRIEDFSFYSCLCLERLVIENGVSEIGAYSFGKCTVLSELVLPDKLAKLDREAFKGCENLSVLHLPDTVDTVRSLYFLFGMPLWDNDDNSGELVGEYVFEDCKKIKSIIIRDSHPSFVSVDGMILDKDMKQLILCPACMPENCKIPDGIVTIRAYAFRICRDPIRLILPASVENIEVDVFFHNQFSYITVDENNPFFASKEGVLFDKEMKILYRYPKYKDGEYVIPDSVTIIGNYAFCSTYDLKNVVINEGVVDIGVQAFAYCKGLNDVIIPTGVRNIGESAFERVRHITYDGKAEWRLCDPFSIDWTSDYDEDDRFWGAESMN